MSLSEIVAILLYFVSTDVHVRAVCMYMCVWLQLNRDGNTSPRRYMHHTEIYTHCTHKYICGNTVFKHCPVLVTTRTRACTHVPRCACQRSFSQWEMVQCLPISVEFRKSKVYTINRRAPTSYTDNKILLRKESWVDENNRKKFEKEKEKMR